MSDPLRTDSARVFDAVASRDRDARIEELLLTGLDHYFAGRYGDAVNVWTRVLFLDRGHARARAYIERARNAQAERDRESDELLHEGAVAFESGEVGTARKLLTAAVERGAEPDVALAYLGRLDRLDRAPGPGTPVTALEARPSARPALEPPRRLLAWPNIALAGAAAFALVGIAGYGAAVLDVVEWRRPGDAQALVTPAAAVPVPRATDFAVVRARKLLDAGQTREALALVASVPAADVNRPEADRLLVEIQDRLLEGVPPEVPR